MTTTIPSEPLGRKETYLAAIAGEDVTIPEPLGREEMYLAYIAENGGGGGGGTNNYNQLINKPQINGVTLQGNKTGADLNLNNYNGLINQPKINSVTLTGNKSASDLGLAGLEGNTFTQTQKVNSAAYAGMKLQDGSDPTNIFADFGKTGMYISDGDGVVTLAYKNIANKTELGGKEDTSNKVTSMSASSTDTQYPSAKAVYDKDANLQTQISNLQNIGRFLAIWNATTGVPTSEPTVQPYNYRTGDYYRVGTAGTRIPTGSEYVIGGTNYVEGDECAIGDVFYYDGTNWKKQASGGGGTVQDVQVNGVSVLSGGIANVPVPTVTQSTGTSTTDVMSQNAATSMVYDNNSKSRVNIGNSNTTSASTPAVVIGTHCDALGGYTTAIQGSTSSWYSTAIGGYIPSGANYAVHIGGIKDSSYKVQSEYAVGLGSKSKVPTNASGSIALGAYSGDNITSAGMIDAGSSDTTTGYNSSNYRLLTGLYDPQNDHDAATKGYVDSHSGGGVQYTSQSGAPNDNDGNYGDLSESTGTYRDAVFIKTQWGPRKWQQIITNQNPLDNGIRILDKATGNNFLVMESGVSSNKGGVSLGVGANTPSQGTVDIGTTSTYFGYNNSQYRLLTGLYDGQSAHDAATKGQLDTKQNLLSLYKEETVDTVETGYEEHSKNATISIANAEGETNWNSTLTVSRGTTTQGEEGGQITDRSANIGFELYDETTGKEAIFNAQVYSDTTGEEYSSVEFTADTATFNSQQLATFFIGDDAPTTTTEGNIGTFCFYNGSLYVCTAVDKTDPENIEYTWEQVTA